MSFPPQPYLPPGSVTASYLADDVYTSQAHYLCTEPVPGSISNSYTYRPSPIVLTPSSPSVTISLEDMFTYSEIPVFGTDPNAASTSNTPAPAYTFDVIIPSISSPAGIAYLQQFRVDNKINRIPLNLIICKLLVIMRGNVAINIKDEDNNILATYINENYRVLSLASVVTIPNPTIRSPMTPVTISYAQADDDVFKTYPIYYVDVC
jgi:hypothetical protein